MLMKSCLEYVYYTGSNKHISKNSNAYKLSKEDRQRYYLE